ncbi:MAG: helix-turn-helix transcriptional regulator [Gammaproteobacteria bacterium]|nr:helix-turn-helix transcriptional regulator [Gammaproteobacteria bacterium]
MIVGQIYDAVFDAEIWPDLLNTISEFCGVESTAMVATDPHVNYSSVVAPRADPTVISDYGAYWWEFDPTRLATDHAPVGQITSLDNTGRDKFYGSGFYNDFWRHSGLGAEQLAANLLTDNKGGFVSVALHPSRHHDRVDDGIRQRFGLLVPHLIRAAGIGRKMRRLELEKSILDSRRSPHHAGTIIVDARGQLLYADEAAEKLFASRSGVDLVGGGIRLATNRDNARLSAAITACVVTRPDTPAGQRIHQKGNSSRPSLTIDVLPFRRTTTHIGAPCTAVMLLIEQPDRGRNEQIARLRSRFGLTPAEAKLALEMLRGDGRAAAAERCGISINTARTQLTQIFQKANVKRQAELIKVLMDNGAII